MKVKEIDPVARPVYCNLCGWSGRMGQLLITADRFLCPNCLTGELPLLVSETPDAKQ